jgi:mRNA interferase HigB
MRIISRRRLQEFSAIHPDAAVALDNWYRIAKSAQWKDITDVKQVYPTADAAGDFTVFNIRGNNYRLIVAIVYSTQRIYIKYVLTHAEYDKEDWKNDPYY